MTLNIKEQFVNLINESTWINKKIKNQGIELLENITIIIGYDGKYNHEIVKYYESLEIDTSNYLQTLLNLELFHRGSDTVLDLNATIARAHPTSSHYHNHQGLLCNYICNLLIVLNPSCHKGSIRLQRLRSAIYFYHKF